MGATRSGFDWRTWLDRWDAQQAGYIPEREARFAAILDVEFLAIDLGCGSGSLSG